MEALILTIPLWIALLVTTPIVICLRHEHVLGLTYGYDEDTHSIISFKEKEIYNKSGYVKFKENDFVGLGLKDSKHCIENILPELDESRQYWLVDKSINAFKKNGYVYVRFSIHRPLINPLTIITKKKAFDARWLVWLIRKFI